MKTGRRNFLKGLLGVAVAPSLVIAKIQKKWFSRKKPTEIAQEIDIDYIDVVCKKCPELTECMKHPWRQCPLPPQYYVIEEYPAKDKYRLVEYRGNLQLKEGMFVRFIDEKLIKVERVSNTNVREVAKLRKAGWIKQAVKQEWAESGMLFYKGWKVLYGKETD